MLRLQLMNEMRQKDLKPTKNTYLAALNAMAEVRTKVLSSCFCDLYRRLSETLHLLLSERPSLRNGDKHCRNHVS